MITMWMKLPVTFLCTYYLYVYVQTGRRDSGTQVPCSGWDSNLHEVPQSQEIQTDFRRVKTTFINFIENQTDWWDHTHLPITFSLHGITMSPRNTVQPDDDVWHWYWYTIYNLETRSHFLEWWWWWLLWSASVRCAVWNTYKSLHCVALTAILGRLASCLEFAGPRISRGKMDQWEDRMTLDPLLLMEGKRLYLYKEGVRGPHFWRKYIKHNPWQYEPKFRGGCHSK